MLAGLPDKMEAPGASVRLTGRTGRGGFNSIVKLSRDASGLWRGTRDIKLEHVAV